MKSPKNLLFFLVDDDALFLKSLEIDFERRFKVVIQKYATGEQCLENLSQNPDVIILDYYLDSIDKTAINGLETLAKIKSLYPKIPVIMLSSQDSIEVAVNCMKLSAYDYIMKSETAFFRLEKAITNYFNHQKLEKALSWYMERV